MSLVFLRGLAKLAIAASLMVVAWAAEAASASGIPFAAMADAHFSSIPLSETATMPVVDSVAQDRLGFIWFVFSGQLERWDGYRSTIRRAEAADAGSPPPDITAPIFTDQRGDLWVGASDGLVARYDAVADRFERWAFPASLRENVSVLSIAQESPESFLFATTRGVVRLQLASGGQPARWSVVEGLGDRAVDTLVADPSGRAWAGTQDGLYALSRDGSRFEPVPLPLRLRHWRVLTPSDGKTLWITSDTELVALDVDTLAVRRIPAPDGGPAALRHVFSGVVRLDASHVWLASYEGVLALDEAAGSARWIQHDARLSDSLPGNEVRAILRDRSGLVWVATNNGAAVHDPSRRGVTTVSTAGDSSAMLNLSDGRVLVGSWVESSGLRILAPGQAALQPFGGDSSRVRDYGLARLADGSVLVATHHGLLHFDGQGRLRARYPALNTTDTLRADGGQVWIAGADGLWLADAGHLESPVQVYRPRPDKDPAIAVIGPSLGGRRFIGSTAALFLFDEADHSMHELQAETLADELPRNRIAAVVRDGRGRIWVASAGSGLYVLTPGSAPDRFRSRHLSSRTGLPSDIVDTIVFDRKGVAWLSTDGGGIVAVDPDSLATRVYDAPDGATFNGYWVDSGLMMADGTLLFGSPSGITVVHPDEVSPWGYLPPTVATSAQLGDGARFAGLPAPGLTLGAGEHKFNLEFAALDYSFPSRNRYRYQLEGVDEHWIDTDPSRRQAAYTNLAPGRYLLRLQGSNRRGAWGRELQVPVQVLPSWYQAWWSRSLFALLAIGLAAAVHFLVTRRLRLQRARLERTVAARTHELATLTGGIAHDFNNILGAILGFGERALRDAGEGSRLQRDLRNVIVAGERGRELVDRILSFSRGNAAERVRVGMEAIVRESLALFGAKLPPRIRLEARLQAGRAAILGNVTQIHQLVMNLAMNALQAMPGEGVLAVSLDVEHVAEPRQAAVGAVAAGTWLVLRVADQGLGIPEAALGRIFDPFFTTKAEGVGTGLGLSLVRRIVVQAGGAIDVDSAPGRGSVFTVWLPRDGDVDAAGTADETSATPPRGRGQRILVVDDEALLLELTTDTLRELGYQPVGVASAQAALDLLRAGPERFDALVTDLRMPGLPGEDLIREARRLDPLLPVILVSGFLEDASSFRADGGRADEVLTKPLRADALAASLARILAV